MMLHPAVQQYLRCTVVTVQTRWPRRRVLEIYEQRGVLWRSFSGSVASRWRGQDHSAIFATNKLLLSALTVNKT